MADVIALAKIYARKKARTQLEKAQEILMDSALESDDVRSQQLEEVGFSFQVKTVEERERAILMIEAALDIQSGEEPPAARGHFMDFSQRRIE